MTDGEELGWRLKDGYMVWYSGIGMGTGVLEEMMVLNGYRR